MKLLVTLTLAFTLFTGVLLLLCHQCVPVGSEPCASTQITCTDQCASATVSISTGGSGRMNFSMQTCSTSDVCVNGSLNTGTINMTSAAKCCGTDLCNHKILPAPPPLSPNGMLCYTCDPKGCSRTLKCVGDQNRCITSSVHQGLSRVSMKGCASRSFCELVKPISVGIAMVNVTCCEGKLCNAAEIFTLGFLLTLCTLLSSVLSSVLVF